MKFDILLQYKKYFSFNAPMIFLDAIFVFFGSFLFFSQPAWHVSLGAILILFASMHFTVNLMFFGLTRR
jgi:hypothetical protein